MIRRGDLKGNRPAVALLCTRQNQQGRADKAWSAFQISSTAALRLGNFFTGLRLVNGVTPAKLFQISTGRRGGPGRCRHGHFLARAKIFGIVDLCGSRCSSEAKAVMLLLASIVKVFMAIPFITLFQPKAKSLV